MRYRALAADYDGTLATDGVVDDRTIDALERLVRSGRRLLLVTGRRLPHLEHAFPRLDLVACLVAENGALLHWPRSAERRVLAAPVPVAFVKALRDRGVEPLEAGESIVATWEPHRRTVLDVIGDLGLDLRVVLNKGNVMVLPSGVDKASGLVAALDALALSPHQVVGVGDAENDLAFLDLCGYAVAVANALPALKERCDLVTDADHGAGVVELVDRMLAADLPAGGGRPAAPGG
jgi:hydroxymethylpyrimidine pyrophosphatase-like HAD family hydrolase